MSAAVKAFYYGKLRDAGLPFAKHYRDYTTDELKAAFTRAVEEGMCDAPTESELAEVEERVHRPKPRKEPTSAQPDPGPPPLPQLPDPPRANAPAPDEMAGARLNTKDAEDVIRIDDQGRHWLQEEVQKPAYPRPRGRRVLNYRDPGIRQETVKTGEYTETFEIAGDPRNATPSQVKITLPSYQVGIYRDRRFPFKVVTYNGNQGFDRLEVEAYYGGADLVPATVKRKYVENVLCYDMRSVIQTIQTEYRQLQLAGKI